MGVLSMAVRDVGERVAAFRHRGRNCRAQTWADEQKGFQSPTKAETGFSVQIPDFSRGVLGRNPAPGPGGRAGYSFQEPQAALRISEERSERGKARFVKPI